MCKQNKKVKSYKVQLKKFVFTLADNLVKDI